MECINCKKIVNIDNKTDIKRNEKSHEFIKCEYCGAQNFIVDTDNGNFTFHHLLFKK